MISTNYFSRRTGTRSRTPSLQIGKDGKVHNVPKTIPKDWGIQELMDSAAALKKSIKARQAEMIELGETTPAGPAHRLQIAVQRDFLRQILNKLGMN
jgi:hypothetical protein